MEIKVNLEELRKRKLLIAVPMYGGNCTGIFAKSVADLTSLCTQYGIPMQQYFLFNESLVTRARNYCCDEFMRSDASHLMFIDADIGFNPQDVIALMALQSSDDKYDIIGGPYPKKTISWEKIKHAVDLGVADKDPNVLEKYVGDYVFNPKSGQNSISLAEPVEVLEIGTGFMMISRKAMETFVKEYPHYAYRPDHVRTDHFDGSRKITQFFQAEIDKPDAEKIFRDYLDGLVESSTINTDDIEKFLLDYDEKVEKASLRYLSEDYWFCQKTQAIGLKTWFCPWMVMQHVGTYIFGGSLADLASIGVSATANPDKLGGKKKKVK
jgi:hypothetical protein